MTVLHFDSEDKWLEARRRYVTSTEVSALFGQNPRLTAFELACAKKNPALDPFIETERTKAGKRLQSAIGAWAAEDNGLVIQPLDYKLATLQHCAASGDFMIVDVMNPDSWFAERFTTSGNGVLEIKNVDSLIFKNEWSDEDMPDHIEIQLQAEILCWNVQWGAVAALVGGNRMALYLRARDEKVCQLIEDETSRFMTNLAGGVLPPPIMPQDAGMVIALNQYAEPNKVINATDLEARACQTLHDLCKSYKDEKAMEATHKELAQTYQAKIFDLIGDAERVINIPGFNLSASVRAPAHIEAYTRAGFRGLNVTVRKERGKGKV